jgi:thiol:disulfide interchange protein DsbC
MKATRIALSLSAALFCGNALANNAGVATDNIDVEDAQQRLQTSFKQMEIVDFKPAPIDGLFEVNTGQGIIYYHPAQELLVFGEIYNKDGESLTLKSMQASTSKMLDRLPMDSAIEIGPEGGIELIEFTDPDCPYCLRYHSMITEKAKDIPIRRKLFFLTGIHPQAVPKMKHIICSDDKDQAYEEAYSQAPHEWKDCDGAEAILAQHQDVVKGLGVAGTPSFLMDGKVEMGFRPDVINAYLATKSNDVEK